MGILIIATTGGVIRRPLLLSELRNNRRQQTGHDENVIFMTDRAGLEGVAKMHTLPADPATVGNHRRQSVAQPLWGQGGPTRHWASGRQAKSGKSPASQAGDVFLLGKWARGGWRLDALLCPQPAWGTGYNPSLPPGQRQEGKWGSQGDERTEQQVKRLGVGFLRISCPGW